MTKRLSSALAFVLAALLAGVPSGAPAQAGPGRLTLGAVGVWLGPDGASVAVTIRKEGGAPAAGVAVTAVRLGGAALVDKAPLALGTIAAGRFAAARAFLSRDQLEPGGSYPLVVSGTAGGAPFALRGSVRIPPAAGEANSREAIAAPHVTKGARYPHRPPGLTENENAPRWVVPNAPNATPAKPTQPATRLQRAPNGDPPGVNFTADAHVGISSSSVAEPSGATGGGVVFVTSNWYAAYSTNNGGSFTQLDPTTIFPNNPIGFCCDQVVQYIPSIDRFVWLIQGNGSTGMRLAAASPAQIKNNGGTSWTYWDLPSSLFSQPAGSSVDYPDLAVGDTFLYMSWDTCFLSTDPPKCSQGREIVRGNLADIKNSTTLHMRYTNPPDSLNAWGSHLSQNTGNEVFWAGQNNNASVRVFRWPASSTSYSWTDVAVGAWANTGLSSTTPDGNDWMTKLSNFPNNAVIGATRARGQVWLAWSAGTNGSFRQPHVEMITVDPNNGMNLVRQVQIWNSDYAFGYPALATNACTKEVGLSLEYGGNKKYYENHVVGFWGDFLVYITTNSNLGVTRYGDYVTLRQDPGGKVKGAFFDAFGYGMNAGPKVDTHYVQFGRTSCG